MEIVNSLDLVRELDLLIESSSTARQLRRNHQPLRTGNSKTSTTSSSSSSSSPRVEIKDENNNNSSTSSSSSGISEASSQHHRRMNIIKQQRNNLLTKLDSQQQRRRNSLTNSPTAITTSSGGSCGENEDTKETTIPGLEIDVEEDDLEPTTRNIQLLIAQTLLLMVLRREEKRKDAVVGGGNNSRRRQALLSRRVSSSRSTTTSSSSSSSEMTTIASRARAVYTNTSGLESGVGGAGGGLEIPDIEDPFLFIDNVYEQILLKGVNNPNNNKQALSPTVGSSSSRRASLICESDDNDDDDDDDDEFSSFINLYSNAHMIKQRQRQQRRKRPSLNSTIRADVGESAVVASGVPGGSTICGGTTDGDMWRLDAPNRNLFDWNLDETTILDPTDLSSEYDHDETTTTFSSSNKNVFLRQQIDDEDEIFLAPKSETTCVLSSSDTTTSSQVLEVVENKMAASVWSRLLWWWPKNMLVSLRTSSSSALARSVEFIRQRKRVFIFPLVLMLLNSRLKNKFSLVLTISSGVPVVSSSTPLLLASVSHTLVHGVRSSLASLFNIFVSHFF